MRRWSRAAAAVVAIFVAVALVTYFAAFKKYTFRSVISDSVYSISAPQKPIRELMGRDGFTIDLDESIRVQVRPVLSASFRQIRGLERPIRLTVFKQHERRLWESDDDVDKRIDMSFTQFFDTLESRLDTRHGMAATRFRYEFEFSSYLPDRSLQMDGISLSKFSDSKVTVGSYLVMREHVRRTQRDLPLRVSERTTISAYELEGDETLIESVSCRIDPVLKKAYWPRTMYDIEKQHREAVAASDGMKARLQDGFTLHMKYYTTDDELMGEFQIKPGEPIMPADFAQRRPKRTGLFLLEPFIRPFLSDSRTSESSERESKEEVEKESNKKKVQTAAAVFGHRDRIPLTAIMISEVIGRKDVRLVAWKPFLSKDIYREYEVGDCGVIRLHINDWQSIEKFKEGAVSLRLIEEFGEGTFFATFESEANEVFEGSETWEVVFMSGPYFVCFESKSYDSDSGHALTQNQMIQLARALHENILARLAASDASTEK